jgi:HNH endonuclease
VKQSEDRFWAKVDKSGEHWTWTGSIDRYGYGRFSLDSSNMPAHRVSFWMANGYWPDITDHLCRVRHCVRPDHLEDVTIKENVLRGEGVAAKFAARDECPQGHEFTKENTKMRSDGGRRCRTCEYVRESNRDRSGRVR